QINRPIPASMAVQLETGEANSDTVELGHVSIAYKALHEVQDERYSGPQYLTSEQYAEEKRAERHREADPDEHYLPRYEVEVLDPVVDNVNLRLSPGQYTVLGGASGSGKSTVLSAVAGLLTQSEATFSGTVQGLVSRPVAYLSQHPAFVAETVAEELAMVANGTAAEFVTAATELDTVQLADVA